jgi:hypothetical protein
MRFKLPLSRRLLNRLSHVFLSVLLLTLPMNTQKRDVPLMEMTDPDRQAIRSIVEQQLAAFQRDDAKAAFSFASPAIQQKFETPENFLLMVREAYPAVYRPRSVMFDGFIFFQGIPAQSVTLLSPDGELVKALYLMEKQPDGVWKITGCLLAPLEGQTI